MFTNRTALTKEELTGMFIYNYISEISQEEAPQAWAKTADSGQYKTKVPVNFSYSIIGTPAQDIK
jgi:hypothetical protein